MEKIVVISGPTASGKTQLSLKLPKKIPLKCEIVNFDSLIFYKELSIGSAKPSKEELSKYPHHFINIRSIKNPLNAHDFMRMGHETIQDILKKNAIPILVGGSGFYLQTLLKGMWPSKGTPAEIISRSNRLYDEQGISPFLEILKEVDPQTFSLLHPNDHYRIRRAVEHFWSTKTKFSKAKEVLEKKAQKSKNNFDVFHIYLDIPKDIHQKIIEERASKMIEDGLEKEVRDLLNCGFKGTEKPLRSIGYKQMVQYINKEIVELDDCKEQIIIATRQLAKAQRTWFKKVTDKNTYNLLSSENQILEDVSNWFATR